MNDIHLLNERYIDSKYQISKILHESWSSMSPAERQFLRECEDLGAEESTLHEGPLDNLKARATGLATKASNVGKALTGKGDQVKDPTQAKIDSRVQSFKNNFAKALEDLKTDFNKMGINDPENPGLKALEYASQSAQRLKIEPKPNPAIQWASTALDEIKQKAANSPVIQNSKAVIDDLGNKLTSKIKDSKADEYFTALGEIANENPKMTNFIIGALVAVSKFSGVPGMGTTTGFLLRTIVGMAKGQTASQALGSAAKVAGAGYLVGSAASQIANLLPGATEVGLDVADGESGEIQSGDEVGSDYVQKTANGYKLSGGIRDLIDNKTDIILKDIEGVESVDQLDPKVKNMLLRGLSRGDSSSLMGAARRELDLMIMGYNTDGEIEGFETAINKYMIKNLANDTDGKFYKALISVDDSSFDSGPN